MRSQELGDRVFAYASASLCFLAATFRLPLAHLSPSRALPLGLRQDQSFYLWAIERARRSPDYSAYMRNCSWSDVACFDLRAVPQEWNLFYVVGSLASWFSTDAIGALFWCTWISLFLGVVGATFFIGSVTRNWIVAGALGSAVGLLDSVLLRTGGQFSLVHIWPSFFFLGCAWRAAEASLLGRGAFARPLAASCVFLFLTVLTSFYYAVFCCLASIVLLASFLVMHTGEIARPPTKRTRLRWTIGAASLAATALLSAYPARYVVLASEGAKHAATYRRPASDVAAYSADWLDYVVPGEHAALTGAFGEVGIHPKRTKLPFEVSPFLGTAFLAFFVLTVLGSWRFLEAEPDSLRGFATFAAAFLVVAFFSTAAGGAWIHAVVPALRCYSRLAPFAALMAATSAAHAQLAFSRRTRFVSAALLLLAVGTEQSGNRFLDGTLLVGTQRIEPTVERLREECRTRSIRLVPPAPDYMFGPYPVYFLAELAGCRLTAVGGPGEHPRDDPAPLPARPSFRALWVPGDLVDFQNVELAFGGGRRLSMAGVL